MDSNDGNDVNDGSLEKTKFLREPFQFRKIILEKAGKFKLKIYYSLRICQNKWKMREN
jgi:hypothetical protein